ncbi:MAG: F0F1 ATP synthase subunit A [Deltaproteobacteria bacterium]|nr:F0F1 ATP synthase subunit A [Deltaproteobacteria bacterium]
MVDRTAYLAPRAWRRGVLGWLALGAAGVLWTAAPAQAAGGGAPAATDSDHAGASHAGGHAHPEPFTWLSVVLGKDASHDGHVAVRTRVEHALAGTPLDKTLVEKKPFSTDGHLTHVFFALVALALLFGGAAAVRRRLAADPDAGVLPERKISALLFFEVVVGAVWNLMKGMMGEAEARRHFPLICTLALYIFTMNALALLPLGAPATDNLNTNIVMGLTVFFVTHASGIRVQGLGNYLKHFAGPVLGLAPLMIVLEIVAHVVRPFSLSLRLLGNMYGDHQVMENFLNFHLPLVPLPVMALGLVVVIVQTVVFTLLSTVFISLAVAHHDDHGDDHGSKGHGDKAHAHAH